MVRNVRQWFCYSIAVEMVVNGVLRTLWIIVNETRCTCTKRSTLKEETNVNHTKALKHTWLSYEEWDTRWMVPCTGAASSGAEVDCLWVSI